MASPILPSPTEQSPSPASEQILSAFFVFSIVESLPAAMYLWDTPASWWFLALVVALPAGLGGATAWAMVCGESRQIGWLRAALAGAVGGLLIPLFLFVALCVVALLFPGEETASAALFGVIAGLLYSYPVVGLLAAYQAVMGLVAGLIYRALGNFSGNGNKIASIKVGFKSRVLRMWAAQFAIVFAVFMIPGCLTAVTLFTTGQTSLATLAAGLSGAIAWTLVCGRLRQPAWWRAALGGALAGILVHPCFWLLASLWSQSAPTGDSMSHPRDPGIYTNAIASFGDLGLVTVPVAIVAGLACRAVGESPLGGRFLLGLWHQADAVSEGHGREKEG